MNGKLILEKIIKRNGVVADFQIEKIGHAIFTVIRAAGWDLKDLLLSGRNGVLKKTESKSAKHLRTALGQIVNFFYTMQGESDCKVYSRIVCYIRPVKQLNNGKHQGFKDRKVFKFEQSRKQIIENIEQITLLTA